jgi:hypothetical protein
VEETERQTDIYREMLFLGCGPTHYCFFAISLKEENFGGFKKKLQSVFKASEKL